MIDIVHSFDVNRLYQYPHSDEAKEAVVKYWQDYAFIEPENVVMTDGSVGTKSACKKCICKARAEAVMFMCDIYRHGQYSRIDGYESARGSD